MTPLIVVACHGPDWIGQCLKSLRDHTRVHNILAVDTSGTTDHGADVALDGGHPTGAYRWAYENTSADEFLFIQDSMTCLEDPLPWFLDQAPSLGAVAWAKFPIQWDGGGQRETVEFRYPGVSPGFGIFGPIFYTTRTALNELKLPEVPTTRLEAQGSEREWAYAFTAAGLEVAGPEWNSDQMTRWGPFRKVFAARP